MIVDCFTFGWELDLLECRLMELNPVVDLFVLCEAPETFQGNPKALHYKANLHRFSRWSHKIIHVIADLPSTDDPWQKEYAQRDAMNEVIASLQEDAIILNGDVDEIPFPSTLTRDDNPEAWAIDYDWYSMAVDWRMADSAPCTVVATKEHAVRWGMAEMRRQRLSLPLRSGGWHFTWLGGAEMIAAKAAAFSHTESSVQDYVRDMGERLYTEGYHVLGEKLIPVDVDDSFPRYVRARHCPETWFRPRP